MRTTPAQNQAAPGTLPSAGDHGIAHLLQADEQLEVSCLKANPTETPRQLRRLKPHAIVLETSKETELLSEAVWDLPPALFIKVSIEDNMMDMYYRRQVMTARPESLLEAVHQGLSRGAS